METLSGCLRDVGLFLHCDPFSCQCYGEDDYCEDSHRDNHMTIYHKTNTVRIFSVTSWDMAKESCISYFRKCHPQFVADVQMTSTNLEKDVDTNSNDGRLFWGHKHFNLKKSIYKMCFKLKWFLFHLRIIYSCKHKHTHRETHAYGRSPELRNKDTELSLS